MVAQGDTHSDFSGVVTASPSPSHTGRDFCSDGKECTLPPRGRGLLCRKLSEPDSYLQFYSHFGRTGKQSTLLGTGFNRGKVLYQPTFPWGCPLAPAQHCETVYPLLETAMGKGRQGLASLSTVANHGEDVKRENPVRQRCRSQGLSAACGAEDARD